MSKEYEEETSLCSTFYDFNALNMVLNDFEALFLIVRLRMEILNCLDAELDLLIIKLQMFLSFMDLIQPLDVQIL